MKRTIFVVMLVVMAATSFALPTSGLYLHLNADSIGADDGDTVNSWADSGGTSGATFTGSATYDADWRSSGHAAISFDGVDQAMSTLLTGAPAVDSMTMIAFGCWNSDVHTYYDYMTAATSTTRARIFESQGDIGGRLGDAGGATMVDVDMDVNGYGSPFAIAVRTYPTWTDVWVMGTDLAFNGNGRSGTVGTDILPGLVLAANGGQTEFSNVDILDVLIYDSTVNQLGSGDVQAIMEELHATYADAVPEPATLALLGLGGLLLRRRK